MNDTTLNTTGIGSGNSLQLRLIAFVLIVIQAVGLGVASNSWTAPIPFLVLALLAVASNRQTPVSDQASGRLIIIAVLLCLLRYLILPPMFAAQALAVRTQLARVVAEFLIVYQLIHLWLTPRDRPLPMKLPWVGVFACLCMADLRVHGAQRWNFQLIAVSYILLLVTWTSMARPFVGQTENKQYGGRTIWIGIFLLITAVLSWGSASLLYRHEGDLDEWMSRYIQQQDDYRGTGFSDSGRLDSVSRMQSVSDDTIVLRVNSTRPPTYMRGAAFLSFVGHTWLTTRTYSRRLTPMDPDKAIVYDEEAGNLFSIRGTSSDELPKMREMECWPNPAADVQFFTTVDSEFVQFAGEQTSVNDDVEILDEGTLIPTYPYRLFYGFTGESPAITRKPKEVCLQRVIRSDALAEKLQRIFDGCETDSDKIDAVKRYFADYQYDESTAVPLMRDDPIEWFLTEKPAGHCEFFASGAVALLRLAKIPSRYVTGVIVTEQNLYGDQWIARNRDAHAWAEAWLPNEGWVVVETTPPDGQPQPRAASNAWQLIEYLQSQLTAFRANVAIRGYGWLGSKLLRILIHPVTLVTICLTSILLWLRERRGKKTVVRTEEVVDPVVIELNRLLLRMDQQVASDEFRREPHETLHQFAQRLENAKASAGEPQSNSRTLWANWYRTYAAVRYGADHDEGDVRQLAATLKLR